MADKTIPNRASNMEKAEGDRWTSKDNQVPANPTPGEDVLGRYAPRRHSTPRRYDEEDSRETDN